jgi:hypothetical protein
MCYQNRSLLQELLGTPNTGASEHACKCKGDEMHWHQASSADRAIALLRYLVSANPPVNLHVGGAAPEKFILTCTSPSGAHATPHTAHTATSLLCDKGVPECACRHGT